MCYISNSNLSYDWRGTTDNGVGKPPFIQIIMGVITMINRRLLQAMLAVSLLAGSVNIISAAAPTLQNHASVDVETGARCIKHPRGLSRTAICGAVLCACVSVLAASTAPAAATAFATTAAYTWLANRSPLVWRSTYDADLERTNQLCSAELDLVEKVAADTMAGDNEEHQRLHQECMDKANIIMAEAGVIMDLAVASMSTADRTAATMQQQNALCTAELNMMREVAEGFAAADAIEHERDKAEHERLEADALGAEVLHDIEHPDHHHAN